VKEQDDHLDLAKLVKADLHRHVEGSIRPATAVALGRSNGVFPASMTVEAFSERAVIGKPVDLFEALDRFDLLRKPV
jgi:adenosine deaminase